MEQPKSLNKIWNELGKPGSFRQWAINYKRNDGHKNAAGDDIPVNTGVRDTSLDILGGDQSSHAPTCPDGTPMGIANGIVGPCFGHDKPVQDGLFHGVQQTWDELTGNKPAAHNHSSCRNNMLFYCALGAVVGVTGILILKKYNQL